MGGIEPIDWVDLLDGVNAREGTDFDSVEAMLANLHYHFGGVQRVADYLGVGYGTLCRRFDEAEARRYGESLTCG